MRFVFDNFFSSALAVFLMVFSANSMAADSLLTANGSIQSDAMWKSVGDQAQVIREFTEKSTISSLVGRSLELDETDFKLLLNEGLSSGSDSVASRLVDPNGNLTKTIVLPLPDGSEAELIITPTSIMSAALSQQFPEIKTWEVKGVSEKITGSIDFTPQGFHGMLIMPDGDRVFIQPDVENVSLNIGGFSEQRRYVSFSEKQNQDNFKSEFSCGVADDPTLHFGTAAKDVTISERLLAKPAPDVITYRLAVAATGEYTQFHGGSVSLALSAIVTTINRVNQLYTRDLGIKLELVDQQSDIIYLDPATDPYSNYDVSKLIEENDQNLSINGALSKSEYDVGHVFSAGNIGGLAVVGGVCDDNEKAFGATGLARPFGDSFDLDYVAHELGHQLGGTHTFNSACDGSERTAETAVEPGSGTTIMAYPGICQYNEIQNSVDPQFHLVSIDQIRAVTRTGSGSSCSGRDENATINENPTVNAGADIVLPARTPLMFIAEGADADNDELTYSWEQSDAGTVSDLNVDTGDNALFRSRLLSSNNVRYIPRLSDLFAGTPADGEFLPVLNRDINMVATVRDGKGGLIGDLVKIQVFDTGESFSVTSNMNDQSFGRQDTVNIQWDVASTNVAPIYCANVDIGVVSSDGNDFNIVTTENDGQQQVMVPDSVPAMSDARFIVSCSDSNFFNVSSGRITILDQVGGGSVGASRFIDSSIFSASDGSIDSDGGGSFGFFMLFWSSLFIYIRKKSPVIR